MKPLNFGMQKYEISTYYINTNRPNVNSLINLPRDGSDFDGVWTFFYFGHSKSRNEAFAYMRFASGKVTKKNFNSAEHVFPPQGLYFRLGKAEGAEYAFNGFFYGAEFKF